MPVCGVNSQTSPSGPQEDELLRLTRFTQEVNVIMLDTPEPNPQLLTKGQTRMERIKERGIIRVGYIADRLPFSYQNRDGELVGFDVDLVLLLARDLGVAVEFIPYESDHLTVDLNQDHFDIAVSGIAANVAESQEILFSEPYLSAHLAFVVPGSRLEFLG